MSKLKQIERMELIEKPLPPRKPFRFHIPQPVRSGQRVIGLEKIHFAYGENTVYRGLDLDVERGERTVLVGPNGSGKSTLLKLLAGVIEHQKGERKLGLNAKIGYFSQHRSATLDPAKTVLQEVMDSNGTLSENEARGILGSFLFRKDEIYKKTEILSGGEKTMTCVALVRDGALVSARELPWGYRDQLIASGAPGQGGSPPAARGP